MISSQKEELAHISFPQWDKTEHLSVTPPAPPPSLTLPSLLPVPAPEPELYFCLRLSPGFPDEEVLRSSAPYLIWPYWAFTFVFKFRLPKV